MRESDFKVGGDCKHGKRPFLCEKCHPELKKPLCPTCLGHHNADSDDSRVDFQGYRFRKPFRCICCGKEICMRQFAYGRACGPCDVGACDARNKAYIRRMTHPHPEWWSQHGDEMFAKFVKAVGATPSPR